MHIFVYVCLKYDSLSSIISVIIGICKLTITDILSYKMKNEKSSGKKMEYLRQTRLLTLAWPLN